MEAWRGNRFQTEAAIGKKTAACLLALSFAAFTPACTAEAADITNWQELSSALGTAATGNTLTISGAIDFPNTAAALNITAPNLTLQGTTAAGVASGMGGSVAGLVNFSGAVIPSSLQTQATTLTSGFIANAEAALSGMSAIYGDDATRNTIAGDDSFLNKRKWLNVPTTAAASPYNGLNVANLRFTNASVTYNIPGAANAKAGVVNGLIGNSNTAASDTSLGNVTGNAFTDLSVTMNGAYNTQYLAGGGIIGVRATGEQKALNADAKMGAVSGNYFRGVKVTTTDDDDKDGEDDNAYIEGGGLIGVDAASSPADVTGVAEIGSLTNNLFTDIAIRTDDILIGGGLVGLNNNSKHAGDDPFNETTSVRLNEASGNVFAGNITVDVGYSLRGGGVLGLNGLSTASAWLGKLNNNLFSGVSVTTGSYLRGGGIVGLQTNYIDSTDPGKIGGENGEDPTFDFSSILISTPWTNLDHASGNLFLDSNVAVGTYIEGGGIVGVHSAQGAARLGTLEKNLFQNLKVEARGSSSATDVYGLKGGGVVGVSSKLGGIIDTVSGNYFDNIEVDVTKTLAGGGIVGIQSDAENTAAGLAVGGDVINNSFRNIDVHAGAIEGGGVVGAHGKGNVTGFGGSEAVLGDGLSGNRLRKVTVNADDYISGGGVFGVYSDSGSATMFDVNNNMFDGTTVTAGGRIEGGGLIGVRSDGAGVVANLERNYFFDSNVTAAYIDGGGIIGATSGNPNWSPGGGNIPELGIGKITDNLFAGNTVTAKAGSISGGLIYSYGTTGGGLTLEDSYFGSSELGKGNRFYAANGKVYGTVTVDTGRANAAGSNDPFTLTLSATGGHYTFFDDNVITDIDGVRSSSLYFGTVDVPDPSTGALVHDDADADAKLVVKTEAGGAVFLFDPIAVNQNNGKTFDMEVRPGGNGTSGYFLWWGEEGDVNKFVQDPAPGGPSMIRLFDGTHTQIMDLNIDAPNHAFVLDKGGELVVLSGWTEKGNDMTLAGAVLNGTLTFDLSGNALNDKDKALLKIHNSDTTALGTAYVDLDGSTIRLTPFNRSLDPQAGDRFYLIATDAPGSIEGIPANGWATSARAGYTTRYNFIIDRSVPTGDPDNPEEVTDQYLVARLPYEPTPENPQPTTPPVSGGPDNPNPVNPPTPTPTPIQIPPAPDPSNPSSNPDDPWNPGVIPKPTPMTPPATTDDKPYIPAHETTALTNGRLAGLAFTGARGTWLADHSYESARIALSDDILSGDSHAGRVSAPFAGIDGAWLRVDNHHSHVDIDAMNAIVGFASEERKKGKDGHPDSSFLWAAFIDLGYGDYDTYNNYNYVDNAVIDDIHGDGSLRSHGIGLMARKEWSNGFRLEGSLRAGKLKNEFTARDYLLEDVPLSYKLEAPYYGLHVGAGRAFKLKDPRNRLDVLLRYYWNRQEGDSVVLPDGERVDFLSDDSHRARLGLRFSRAASARRSWYVGAAVEHEFAGDIHARTSKFTLPAPGLEGTTGIGEIGFILRPDKDHHLSLETGIQGYFGKLEGFSAGIRLEWEF